MRNAMGWVMLGTLVLSFAGPLPAWGGAEVRGVSLAHMHRGDRGYGSDDCRAQLAAIRATGANWIAINDYAYMESVDTPNVRFGGDRSLRGENLARVIRDAHDLGLKVLVKPHIWSREFWGAGKWHGDIAMTSEADWDAWFDQYTDYVLFNARIAQETGAAALCVGVEYEGTSQQEARWRKLIAEVRAVYTSHLTYAATFMEWKKVPFWDALDCIGIDAYFPVAQTPLATEAEIRAHWARVYDEVVPFAERLNMPVCFLEIGYSLSSKAGQEPWSYTVIEPDPEYQARLFRVALEEAAQRDVVVGLFVWKWFTSDQYRRSEPFAIQDSPLVLEALRGAWQR